MADTPRQYEAWLRGPVEGIEPLLLPVAHAFIQAQEDLAHLAATVPCEHTWQRPGDAASIGFHVRHLGATVDRLLTYARGEALDDVQKVALKTEGLPGEPPAELATLVADTHAQLNRGMDQVRETRRDQLLETRKVGRLELPTTVLGLLFHAAEHTTRHVGQAITTARILAGT